MRKLLLASAAIVGITGSAFAADPLVYDSAPYVAPSVHGAGPVNWHGVYVGATAGYGWGNYLLFSDIGFGPSVDVKGFVGGATFGANMQNGSVVWGIEADIQNGPKGITPQGTGPGPGTWGVAVAATVTRASTGLRQCADDWVLPPAIGCSTARPALPMAT